jgi:uncharacterized protein
MRRYQLFLPDYYVASIMDIDYDELKKQGIKTLFFDLDNTIMSYDETELEHQYVAFLDELSAHFQIIIMSNSPKSRVARACEPLGLHYIESAKKPFKKSYMKAFHQYQTSAKEAIMIGDQLMTDVLGAHRVSMKAVLVKPVKKRSDHVFTKINRLFETRIIRYVKRHHESEYQKFLKTYAEETYD